MSETSFLLGSGAEAAFGGVNFHFSMGVETVNHKKALWIRALAGEKQALRAGELCVPRNTMNQSPLVTWLGFQSAFHCIRS
jgi:hypothetical protein